MRARPGSGVVYALTVGLVGRHPAVALVVQVALAAATAIALRQLVVRFLPPTDATVVAALWVVLPNHGSLLYWTSGTAITAALLLLLLGARCLADGHDLAGALLLAASVLTYEATGPAAVAATAAVPWLAARSWRRSAVVGAAVLAPVAAWVVVSRASVKRGLGVSADLGLVLPAHVGWGVLPDAVAVAGGAVACVVVTLSLIESVRLQRVTREAGMIGAAVALIVLGTIPFVRYFYAPLGAGDRVNVVAGVGTAFLWAAVFGWLGRRASTSLRPVVAVAVAACVLGFGVATWQRAHAWADAADDAAATLRELRPIRAGDAVVVERPPVRRNVTAFADVSNIRGAAQLEAGTRDVEVELRPGR